jgi:excinuclease ABC subunit C
MLVPPIAIDAADFDEQLALLPNSDAVFAVWAGGRPPYLAKTAMLRRRLQRILRPAGSSARGLNLREVATRVDYWLSGSRFESGLIHYQLAREHDPDGYLKALKLRMPAYLRLTLANDYPRTQITARLGSARAIHYGPFRTRSSAEQFESQMLDLFQIRRCQEDLAPGPNHPGCIYGEMNMCLRPCQEVVGVAEYGSEVSRVADFLTHNGALTIQTISSARERLSEEMQFEEAARQHKRLEQLNQLLSLREQLACDIDHLYGIAITLSSTPDAVKLWFMWQGCWQEPRHFPLTSHVSLDQRLREMVAALNPILASRQERQEHMALLARWNYATWRDGEWIAFESLNKLPYRKVVRAISRVHGSRMSQQTI